MSASAAVRPTGIAHHHRLQDLITELHRTHSPMVDGQVATYIPELGKANPDHFAICLVSTEGDVVEAGDCDVPFTIQSISKPFTFGMVLEELGRDTVSRYVGVERSGAPATAIGRSRICCSTSTSSTSRLKRRSTSTSSSARSS
jgi:glutaminase